IERALAQKPEQRFADGAAFASALATRDTGARGPGLLLAGVAVAGLAVAGVAAILHARGSHPPAELHARDAVSTVTTPTPTPSPSPPPRPARKVESLPLLAHLASNKRAKLVQVLGSYAFKHTAGIEAAAIAPDGATAASGSDDGLIRIWDLETET